jgi:tetratricopeptide (TPR) repeat protein
MKSRIAFSLLTVFLALAGLQPALAAEKQSFQQWLEHYRAWDRLEKEYAQESAADTPEAVLKRAQVYLNLNSPKKALEIIEMTPAFTGKNEADRLWLGGQAHRGLGDLTKAVLWYTQATKFMSDDEIRARGNPTWNPSGTTSGSRCTGPIWPTTPFPGIPRRKP